MRRRVLTGLLVGLGWALLLRYMPGPALFPLLVVFALACQWEFYRLLARGGMHVCPGLGMAWGALWLVVRFAFPLGATALLPLACQMESMVLALMGFSLFILLMFDSRRRRPLEAAALTVLGFFYIPFMLSFYLRLAQWGVDRPFGVSREGVFLAFFLSAIVKLGDTGAYGLGLSLGRRKLLPRISPGKTWEGLAGGLGASALVSVLMVWAARAWPSIPGGPLAGISLWAAALVGLLLGLVGALGDLVESMFKRAVQAKDSSGMFPGMGGMLDIFDSLIFTPPLMFFLLTWCLT